MTNLHANIAIIGGGPAGASTAIYAAQTMMELGLDPSSIVILERKSDPFAQTHLTEKVCGGFVMQDGLNIMQKKLGMDLSRIPHMPINKIILSDGGMLHDPHVHDGRRILVDEPSWGSVFHRMDLDAALLKRAQASGVRILTGHRVTGVNQENGQIFVDAKSAGDGSAVRVATKMLVGAFGANRSLRRQFFACWGAYYYYPHMKDLSVAYRYIGSRSAIALPDNTLHVSFLQYLGKSEMGATYAWDFPTPEIDGAAMSNRGFGFFLMDEERRVVGFRKNEAAARLFPADAKALSALTRDGLFDVRGFPLPTASGGGMYGHDRVVIKGGLVFALVGDAADRVNPLTGEGITEALEDGKIGVQLAHSLQRKNLGRVKNYARKRYFTSASLSEKVSALIALKLFHEPARYKFLLDVLMKNPETAYFLTTVIKRKYSRRNFLTGGFEKAVELFLRGTSFK